MIPLTFANPSTRIDETWSVNFREHSPLLEVRKTKTSNAGDYIDPDVIFKGSYEKTQLISNPVAASEIATFNRLKSFTARGGVIEVDATNVPLVGVVYLAIREGNLVPKSLHGGRYFSFALNLRVVSIIA